jgi:hypothetical protein
VIDSTVDKTSVNQAALLFDYILSICLLSQNILNKVHPLYELRYVTPCVDNLTEENPYVSMFEFPTGV